MIPKGGTTGKSTVGAGGTVVSKDLPPRGFVVVERDRSVGEIHYGLANALDTTGRQLVGTVAYIVAASLRACFLPR